uniref:NADH-ubiquinone oxidoreductase chain 6 n=1 Tax=Storeatula sp. CCMP1868 TaxID=195070 RepID=A0A2P1G849_9CRYP|nr:NADH dehydrogenase subunit 6 [Storeatula sp. CCMP1868]AVM81137.1 NADH dehydrogenase subunit 6 [Storeatula sp. CCMP1868]
MCFNLQLFNLFSFLLCFCAFAVIFSRNPVHSILFLVFLFFNAGALLILLGADFLAVLFLIVYVGAVAVLFLFVLMMLSGKLLKTKINFFYGPLVLLLTFIFLFEIFLIIEQNLTFLSENVSLLTQILNPLFFWSESITTFSNVEIIGSVLYTHFFYFFIIGSLILLVAMIGAIVLTLYKRNDLKSQFIFKQTKKSFEDSIILTIDDTNHSKNNSI